MLPDRLPLPSHLAPVLRKRAAHHHVWTLLLVLPQISPQHPRPALLRTPDLHHPALQQVDAHLPRLHPRLALLARHLPVLAGGLVLCQLGARDLGIAALAAALHLCVCAVIPQMLLPVSHTTHPSASCVRGAWRLVCPRPAA
eukprot:1924850-Rhodomonas_salina.2